MATKAVNPDDPGQAQIFLSDFLLARRALSDFQAMTLLEAIGYEWEFGHAPNDIKVWQRLARPVNGRQKAELVELAEQYDQHILVQKMRDRRTEKLTERLNRVSGAQEREAVKMGMGSDEKTEVRTIEKEEVRIQPSDKDKSIEISEPAPKLPDNSAPSSSSASSSKKNTNSQDNKNNTSSQPSAAALAVFEYWREQLKHPQAMFTRERKRAVLARLKDGYTVDRLQRAVDGCRASPFHQGQNDRQSVYDDLELICRNGKNVEWFIAKIDQPKNGKMSTGGANGTIADITDNDTNKLYLLGEIRKRCKDDNPKAPLYDAAITALKSRDRPAYEQAKEQLATQFGVSI